MLKAISGAWMIKTLGSPSKTHATSQEYTYPRGTLRQQESMMSLEKPDWCTRGDCVLK